MDRAWKWFFSLGILIRVGFLVYGEWHDQRMRVKLTDVDYYVFTDAADYITQGLSPYRRETYRYTPLLALGMLFNIYGHPSFGKILFCGMDGVTSLLMYHLFHRKEYQGWAKQTKIGWVAFYFLNPMVFSISARGNAESILGCLVIATLYCFVENRRMLGAVLFGLSVHFKIYPIIYALPLWLSISPEKDQQPLQRKHTHPKENVKSRVRHFFHWERIRFGLVSGSIFIFLLLGMYLCYGQEFLQETYLYHISRKDHRHNFSHYFYYIYLTLDDPRSTWVGLLSFLPQCMVVFWAGLRFASKNLFFACFAQTFLFVMFNKVCTSQYFLWYICFLPLIAPELLISFKKALLLIVLWFFAQGIWLKLAYDLEFLGRNTFVQLWIAGLIFFCTNGYIIIQLIKAFEQKQHTIHHTKTF